MDPVEDALTRRPTAVEKAREGLAESPRWSKVMLGVAGGMVLFGAVLWMVEGSGTGPAASGAEAPGGAGLVPQGTPPPSGSGVEEEPGWSPAFLKMGFGFFVGFAIGFTLRTFLKLAMLAFGFLFLSLFALSSAGLVTVEWETMGNVFEGWFAHIGDQFSGLKSLITGSLPATGLGAFGLYAGLRKG